MQDTGERLGVGGDNLQMVWGLTPVERSKEGWLERKPETAESSRKVTASRGARAVSSHLRSSVFRGEPASVLQLCQDRME